MHVTTKVAQNRGYRDSFIFKIKMIVKEINGKRITIIEDTDNEIAGCGDHIDLLISGRTKFADEKIYVSLFPCLKESAQIILL
jgi:hypothetical protein